MTADMRCPDAARLQALLDGDLAPDQEAALAEHLKTCDSCRQRLDELTGKLGLLPEAARDDIRRQEPPEPALEGMIADLCREGPGSPGDGVTPAETVTVGESSPAGDISLGFLDPPDRSGCLGKLGDYDVVGIVGQGGMGVVLKGFDRGLNRFVAIKVLAPQLASSGAARRRFSAEAKNAAAITHDHVVTIHAVGEANGMPYLVMEYIVGVSLEDRIRRTGPLKVEEILRIGMQAASGLAAAHAQGLVHRDIKPSNILLENGVERVKITDFGLSRVVHEAEITQSGVVAGTPQYMSPEQARGEPIDRRSDLFSLGCVLYAMCTGRSPFRAATVVDAIRRVCDDTPRPIHEINPEIPDWLAAIIDRLLAKNPDDRFQTAAEVAELLGKYLAHVQQPSQAAMPSPPLVATKQPRKPAGLRWRWVISAAACLAVIGLGIVLWRVFSPAPPSMRFTFVNLSANANRALSDPIELGNPQNNLAELKPSELIVDNIPLEVGRRYMQIRGRSVSGCPEEILGIQINQRAAKIHFLHGCESMNAPHGRTVATYTFHYSDGTVDCLPVVSGRHLQDWLYNPKEHPSVATHAQVAWTGTNPYVGKQGGQLQLFLCSWQNPHPEKEIATLDFQRAPLEGPAPLCVAITCDNDPTPPPPEPGMLSVRIDKFFLSDRFSVAISGCPGSPLGGAGERHDTLLPSGRHAVEIRRENTVVRRGTVTIIPGGMAYITVDCPTDLFPLPSPQPEPAAELIGQTWGVFDVAFSRDGTMLATAAGDGTVVLWRFEQGAWVQQAALPAESDVARAVAFSPDARYLATASQAGTLKLWDVASAKVVRTLEDGGEGIFSVAFSPNGKLLASGNFAGTLTFWDVATGAKLDIVQAHAKIAHNVAFSPDGTLVATSAWSENGESAVKLWASASRELKRVLYGHSDSVLGLAFSPDGKTLASASDDSTVKLWSVESGQLLKSFSTPARSVAVAFSPDGKRVAAGDAFHTVHVWDVTSGVVLHEFHAHWGEVRSIAFAPDGQSIVTAGFDNVVRVWPVNNLPGPFSEPAEFRPLTTFQVDALWSTGPCFSTNNRNLLGAGTPFSGARLWDLANSSPLGRLQTPRAEGDLMFMGGGSPRFIPDGSRTIVCEFGAAKPLLSVWDTETRNCMKTLEPGPLPKKGDWHEARIALAPDGRTLAVTLTDQGLVGAFDPGDFAERWPPVSSPHGAPYSVAFSADSQTLAVGTRAGLIMLLNPVTGKEITNPLRHGKDKVQAIAFSPRGGLLASVGEDSGIVILWDTTNYQPFALPKAHAEKTNSATFSPDGRLLVTTGGMRGPDKAPWTHKGEVCLWDVTAKKLLTKFNAHYGSVTGAAFSPDGKRLATTGRDGKMHLWDVAELVKTQAEKNAK